MPRKNHNARRRPARRRSTSKIAEAQASAYQAREERQKKFEQKAVTPPKTGMLGQTQLRPAQPNIIQRQRGVDQDAVARRERQKIADITRRLPSTPGVSAP